MNLLKFLQVYCLFCLSLGFSVSAEESDDFQSFENFFSTWRSFESPPLLNGAPDYTQATFDTRYLTFQKLKSRMFSYKTKEWTTEEQIDWHIVRAEMNGFDFNNRILKPWQRDPAFYKSVWTYKSDVPAHEGPTHHSVIELWSYQFPLNQTDQARLVKELTVIPAMNEQAKTNLTGNARELWIAGIRDIQEQVMVLQDTQKETESYSTAELKKALTQAISSTQSFVSWLEAQSDLKTGPSGIGNDNYTWYQQNVHLVPMSWEDEVRLLQRELDRAWSSLKLEEHRNRNLPKLVAVKNQVEYQALATHSAKKFLAFLDENEIVTMPDYFEPALKPHLGKYVPEDKRHFFYIGSHFDPTPLYSHFYHWFELARMEKSPNSRLIRKEPLLYNIFDSRNEGTATAVEEIFMHAGLYDDNHRVREIVWIMLAQRAARGLGSLYAHANIMTMEEAGKIHMNWTPRGWMKTEPDLLIFEQHLYLRQPGYGTSYVTGKYLLDKALSVYAKNQEEQGNDFKLKEFLDELNRVGSIPISLGHWQLTNDKTDIDKLFSGQHR